MTHFPQRSPTRTSGPAKLRQFRTQIPRRNLPPSYLVSEMLDHQADRIGGRLPQTTDPGIAHHPAKALQHVMERDILALDSIIKTTLTTKDETEVRDKVTALAAFAPDTDEPVFEVGMIDPDNLLQLAETGLKAILTGW